MSQAPTCRYGVLLPHFGPHASRHRLVEGCRTLEAYGFDSVWVRDHLVYHPHPFEHPDRTHLDPFVVLSAVAGATERLLLGTGSLIPHRHPIHAALLAASLAHIAGPDRVVIGMGLGSFQHEFDAVGLGDADRRDLVREHVEIYRELWTGQPVSHGGRYYRFSDVDIHPAPARPIPVWYCGGSQAAVRRAVEFCDGWMPGLMPMRELRLSIIFLSTVFPILINTANGVRGVDPELVETAVAFNATERQILRTVIIPATLPFVLSGMQIALGRAIIAVIVAEMTVGVSGIGGLIVGFGTSFQTAHMLVPILATSALSVGLVNLLRVMERELMPYRFLDRRRSALAAWLFRRPLRARARPVGSPGSV